MRISIVAILCFGLVLGSCLARDHTQFLRDLQKKLRDEVAIEEFDDFIEGLLNLGSCKPVDASYSCCVKLPVPQAAINVCGIASFHEDTCVNFTVTLNGNAIMTDNITGANPPPICKNFQQGYNACIEFAKVAVDLKGHTFSGCANIQLKKGSIPVSHVPLGCFKLPPKQKYSLFRNRIIETYK